MHAWKETTIEETGEVLTVCGNCGLVENLKFGHGADECALSFEDKKPSPFAEAMNSILPDVDSINRRKLAVDLLKSITSDSQIDNNSFLFHKLNMIIALLEDKSDAF